MEHTEPQAEKETERVMEPSPRPLHTPGPWQWYWRYDSRESDGGATDCGVFWEKRPGIAYSICRAPRYAKQEEWEANARLIAAAPDLLYVLRRLVTELPSRRDWLDPDLEAFARQTIAQAEGAISVQEGNEVPSRLRVPEKDFRRTPTGQMTQP